MSDHADDPATLKAATRMTYFVLGVSSFNIYSVTFGPNVEGLHALAEILVRGDLDSEAILVGRIIRPGQIDLR